MSPGVGRDRLLALCDGYLSYVQRRIFPGGCFFVGASAEVGARAGRLHDEVARVQQQWRDLLGREADAAVDKGQLAEDTDPAQLAFELGVILAGTNIVGASFTTTPARSSAAGQPFEVACGAGRSLDGRRVCLLRAWVREQRVRVAGCGFATTGRVPGARRTAARRLVTASLA